MSQYTDSAFKSFVCSGAIPAFARVILNGSGKLALAGLTDKEIGTIEEASFADGDVRAVRLRTAPGTVKMIAAAAIALNGVVFTAASGQVSNTAVTAFQVGTALEAAGAAGDVIEVLRINHGDTAA